MCPVPRIAALADEFQDFFILLQVKPKIISTLKSSIHATTRNSRNKVDIFKVDIVVYSLLQGVI